MKREFLEGLNLEKEIIDKIMSEHGKTVEKIKTTNEALTVEKSNLEAKLSDANTQIQGFKDMDIEGIKKAAGDWETKYNSEKAAWEREKSDRTYTWRNAGVDTKKGI